MKTIKKMYCSNCENSAPIPSKTLRSYTYSESGIGAVEILNGVTHAQCPKCKETYVRFFDLQTVNRLIFESILQSDELLKSGEIKYIRKYLGYGSEEFAKLMAFSREAYSRLENGLDPLNKRVDRAIRFAALSKPDPDRNYDIHDAIKTNSLTKIKKIIIEFTKMPTPSVRFA